MEMTDCGRPFLWAVRRSDRVVHIQQFHLDGADAEIVVYGQTCQYRALVCRFKRLNRESSCLVFGRGL